MIRRAMLALGLAAFLGGAAPWISFTSVEPRFEPATAAYRAIWDRQGTRIAAALEAASGLGFSAAPIAVIVSDNPPMTAFDGRTIRLRASYSADYKKATLIHELGHSLAAQLRPTAQIDDHRLLYLFLYDAWSDLEGRDFADRMVRIERRIPGGYDYDAAWSWALAMTREERRARLGALSARRAPSG